MSSPHEEPTTHVATLADVEVSITARPDGIASLDRLQRVLTDIGSCVVACSGGIDSLVLATVAHRAAPATTTVGHTVTPAVPGDGTARVLDHAEREGWNLEIVHSSEFDDEAYLSNPVDRCYHCKRNLYDALGELARQASPTDAVVVSGANVDDFGEYRPGLLAAAERSVRHPYVEAGITKAEVRAIARHLSIAHAELPASPCLASRLYTGTRVTPPRLRAIEAGESLVRERTGLDVVRCRLRERTVLVEVEPSSRSAVTDDVLVELERTMVAIEPTIDVVVLDDRGYAPGRAFVREPERVAT